MRAALEAPTPSAELDARVEKVKAAAPAWARMRLPERRLLLAGCRKGYAAVAEESVRVACLAKGIDPDSRLAGEEWLSGPLIATRNLRLLDQSLAEIARHGVPLLPRGMKTLPDGRLAVKVFPTDAFDHALLARHEAWVHFLPGVTAANLREHQASFYRKPHGGKLCLVLGAGNVNAIPTADALYKLFVEGCTVLLKMNPVNAYLGPLLERAFAPLVERGFFTVVYGGAEEGQRLIAHPAVDEVHITGSDQTHDTIVWGPPGPEREARRARGEQLLRKQITSELGNISPVLVVPGPYTDAELAFQGRSLAGMYVNNASFNCNSPKLIVQQRGWALRHRLLAEFEQGLAKVAPRKAYYPRAEERWKLFTEGRPGVKRIGHAGPGELPWALIPDVDPANTQDRVFTTEPWCAVIAETALEAPSVEAYLERAVAFLNERVWGTLCATVIVHPKSLENPRIAAAVDRAIRNLQYGAVATNTWTAAVFGMGNTPWGGHPSSTEDNVNSGRGWVHNTFMLEDVEKVVLTAPLKQWPVPPWWPNHASADVLARRLVALEENPSWAKVPGIVAAAMKA